MEHLGLVLVYDSLLDPKIPILLIPLFQAEGFSRWVTAKAGLLGVEFYLYPSVIR